MGEVSSREETESRRRGSDMDPPGRAGARTPDARGRRVPTPGPARCSIEQRAPLASDLRPAWIRSLDESGTIAGSMLLRPPLPGSVRSRMHRGSGSWTAARCSRPRSNAGTRSRDLARDAWSEPALGPARSRSGANSRETTAAAASAACRALGPAAAGPANAWTLRRHGGDGAPATTPRRVGATCARAIAGRGPRTALLCGARMRERRGKARRAPPDHSAHMPANGVVSP